MPPLTYFKAKKSMVLLITMLFLFQGLKEISITTNPFHKQTEFPFHVMFFIILVLLLKGHDYPAIITIPKKRSRTVRINNSPKIVGHKNLTPNPKYLLQMEFSNSGYPLEISP